MAKRNDTKNLGGRPMRYGTLEALESAIDGYFTQCDIDGKPPIWHGLLLHLDVSDDTLLNYRNNKDNKYPGYSDAIKKAERRLSMFWQQYALDHPNVQTYCIFQLKQPHNGGLSDKQEVSQDMKISLQINGKDANLLG